MKVLTYNKTWTCVPHHMTNLMPTLVGLLALTFSGCNSADLQGNGKSSSSDKDNATTDISEDQTAVPPEVLAGAYLTCGPVDTTSGDLEAGEASADNDVVGCAVLTNETNTLVKIESFETTWTVLDEESKPVTSKPAKLKQDSKISFAAIVEKGMGSKHLKIDVKFPKSLSNKGAMRSDYSSEECAYAAFCPKDSSYASPGGACAAESATLKTGRGGCTHLPSGIVVGGLNLDPSSIQRYYPGGQFSDKEKSMKFTEAYVICEAYKSSGYKDWRLPTKEEFNILQAAGLEGKLHFLNGADGKLNLSRQLSLDEKSGSDTNDSSSRSFWTSTKVGDESYSTCSIYNKNCAEKRQSDEQYSFCIRLSK